MDSDIRFNMVQPSCRFNLLPYLIKYIFVSGFSPFFGLIYVHAAELKTQTYILF